ncbi:class I SAM-dependent methyltransferase [Aquicella lusitana]|uniref:Caffeoyl-CoA O-methyltransferase n=1 Tax=Aquicella lusitana TaxID=254246 RepID=A0A370GGR2_9COXI|nr:class I SAM-dependent methyltransferase [Aquicella lusitana]RDI42857.1 caffeoyl-CoA O-methyltransferase [Aquicella lusitana]VVC73100.1 Putative O-methyltransferase/MSMEI_4947 [Aquicella lusitana]
MSDVTINLTPTLYRYLCRVSLREPAVLKKLREETHKLNGARMQISPEQGQFMALLVELLGAKKTIDIGTFTGYSALVVALALPPEGRVITCDIDTQAPSLAKLFWEEAGVAQKIDLRIAPALETLQKLLDEDQAGTFDFIFIDADKTNYLHYYEKSLTLLRTGGLVAIDNVLWDGKVADPAVDDKNTLAIRACNEKLASDARVTLSMIPIGDGLTLARKR